MKTTLYTAQRSTLHRQVASYMRLPRRISLLKVFINAEQVEPQGIKAHQSRAAQAFPLYTVIMLIVNQNHHLHTLPTIPLGRADQGQHAAVQMQKRKQGIALKKESCNYAFQIYAQPVQYSNMVVILELYHLNKL